MPEFQFNISEVLRRAFGISGYQIDTPESSGLPSYKEVSTISLAQVADYGPMGYPIFDVVRFKGGTVPGTDEIFESLDLRDFPLVQVSRQKNILETVVVGKAGTVKELISNGDHSIQIRGGSCGA